MEIEVNKHHKKAYIKDNRRLKKNVSLVVLGVVIGIGVFSGCSSLKKINSKDKDVYEKISSNTSDSVEINYDLENNTYDVSMDDGKVSTASLAIALSALGVSLGTNAYMFHKLKKKNEETDYRTLMFNYNYNNRFNGRNR